MLDDACGRGEVIESRTEKLEARGGKRRKPSPEHDERWLITQFNCHTSGVYVVLPEKEVDYWYN